MRLQTKTRRFSSKPLERQFEVNSNFKELTCKALAALKRGNKKKVKVLLRRLRDGITEHEEDLIIADTSPNGWLAVAKLRGRTELPEDLRKKLERVDKELWRSRSYGRTAKKSGPVPGPSGGSHGGEVRTARPAQQKSPEEVLFNASRQVRAGDISQATCWSSQAVILSGPGLPAVLRFFISFLVSLILMVMSSMGVVLACSASASASALMGSSAVKTLAKKLFRIFAIFLLSEVGVPFSSNSGPIFVLEVVLFFRYE